ncbi:hypothetical protein BU14_0298s0013 [Porphyra umbilicalis]|uniref:Uncharacterized protein n=1 Tax=Porphyra umbilicalis TaxID=2786 RepID=A0A1X6P074_PORUM|nr:hypothetical protein BU14_0298s0013 [Porphyra umbilicalis]|eukprot:OSX74269.1 hypothetical protein BU14_0298s0013 [Porphyra umbilicalis]
MRSVPAAPAHWQLRPHARGGLGRGACPPLRRQRFRTGGTARRGQRLAWPTWVAPATSLAAATAADAAAAAAQDGGRRRRLPARGGTPPSLANARARARPIHQGHSARPQRPVVAANDVSRRRGAAGNGDGVAPRPRLTAPSRATPAPAAPGGGGGTTTTAAFATPIGRPLLQGAVGCPPPAAARYGRARGRAPTAGAAAAATAAAAAVAPPPPPRRTLAAGADGTARRPLPRPAPRWARAGSQRADGLAHWARVSPPPPPPPHPRLPGACVEGHTPPPPADSRCRAGGRPPRRRFAPPRHAGSGLPANRASSDAAAARRPARPPRPRPPRGHARARTGRRAAATA